MGDDDRTVMMTGFREGTEPGEEATVMASAFSDPVDQDDVATRMVAAFDGDAQEAATVMVSAHDSARVAAAVAAADARYAGAGASSPAASAQEAPGEKLLASLGALGPLLSVAGIVLLVLPQFGDLLDPLWALEASPPAMLAGHLLVALGLVGARRWSSGAWILGALANLVAAGVVATLYVGRLDPDLLFFTMLVSPVAWALTGVWALSGGPRFGGGGLFLGMMLLVGGGAMATALALQRWTDVFPGRGEGTVFVAVVLAAILLLLLGLTALSMKFAGRRH